MDFIGIDVGTSGCKASVVTEGGTVKKSASRGYMIHREQSGWAYLDMRQIWNCVQEVLTEIAPEASEVKAAAVSSLGETLVFLDEEDRLLWDDGITYIDSRNAIEWEHLKEKVAPDVLFDLTGKDQPQIASVNQFHYWRKAQGERFSKIRRILFPDSFIAYMLCGEAAFDYSTASNSLLFDINTYQWSSFLAESYDIDLGYFPRVTGAGSELGKIRKSVCEKTGLPEGITILAGCHDQISATVGSGAILPGEAGLGEGSTESLNLLIDSKAVQELKRSNLPIEPYIEKGTYFCLVSRLMHGNCIKWFTNTFKDSILAAADSGVSVYDVLGRYCPEKSTGIVFLPYLSGTYFIDSRRPMGSFIGMDTSTDVFALYRAMLEGLSCESAALFEEAESCGAKIRKITATGGASKSDIYMQIKADITGRAIRTTRAEEAGITGLAMLCATRMGCYGSLEEAGKVFVKTAKIFEPQCDSTEILRHYRKVSSAVREAYAG